MTGFQRFVVALGLAGMLLALGAGQALAAPAPFRDCPNCPSMIVIPAGAGVVGGVAEVQARQGTPPDIARREQPRHEVIFARPFALGRTHVTRGEYAAFIKATSRTVTPGCNALDVPTNKWGPNPALSWRDPGFKQTDADPVVCVSWPDATAYAQWLATRTGKPYRLPSEAEFEYAARAGSGDTRYWGESAKGICGRANGSGLERAEAMHLTSEPEHFHQCRDGYVYTSPVAHFPPNAFGLYDMLGNAWQWTEDCFNPDHTGAPANGEPRMTGDCTGHVDKGSSWGNSPHYLSAAARHKDLTDARNTVLGFRVARDLPDRAGSARSRK